MAHSLKRMLLAGGMATFLAPCLALAHTAAQKDQTSAPAQTQTATKLAQTATKKDQKSDSAQTQTAAKKDQESAPVQSQKIEQIVVTAQKRAQPMQNVPIAITAFSARDIASLGFTNALDVASQTPNFQMGGLAGATDTVTPWLNIRGIQFTDTSFVNDQSVAMYVDGIYQAATGAGVQQLYDVERVEVLKGPQGSLFGRNSSAGLVQYFTRQPTRYLDGYVDVTYGQYNTRAIEGAISGPITDKLSGRLAGRYSGNDGYRHNPVTGTDSFGSTNDKAVRGTLEYDANQNVTITASAHFAKGDNTFPGRDMRGTRNPNNLSADCTPPVAVFDGKCSTYYGFINSSNNPNVTYSVRPSPETYQAYGGYLKVDYNWNDINIVSLTGYENWRSFLVQDTGMGSLSAANITADFRNKTHNFSEELRASGQHNGSKWLLGAYYYRDSHQTIMDLYDWYAKMTHTSSPVPDLAWLGQVDATSYALFGQLETPISRTVSVTIGGRYSKEARNLVHMRFYPCDYETCDPLLNANEGATFSNFSGDITLRWKPTDNIMTYAKFARGFKSGGWNPMAATLAAAGPASPEIVDDWEVGLKADWWDHRLRTDISAFYYDFKGLQSSLNQIVHGSPVANFINAGDATIYGSEWEITALPFRGLEVRLGIGTLATRIDKVAEGGLGVLPGNQLPDAPDINANGLVKYTFDLGDMGSLGIQGDFRAQSHVFFTVDNDPYRAMKAYSVYNARLLWDSQSGKYSATFAVENLANKRYATGAFHTPSFDVMYFEPGAPRWWTLKFGIHF